MKTHKAMKAIVKSVMGETDIKQKYLAKKCGYDEKTFSLLINGKKQITDVDIESFCNGMEVLPGDVIKLQMKSTPMSH